MRTDALNITNASNNTHSRRKRDGEVMAIKGRPALCEERE